MGRVNARDAAMTVAADGIRWVTGRGWRDAGGARGAASACTSIHAAQAGLIADMDAVADHLYGRA